MPGYLVVSGTLKTSYPVLEHHGQGPGVQTWVFTGPGPEY